MVAVPSSPDMYDLTLSWKPYHDNHVHFYCNKGGLEKIQKS